MAKRMWIVMLYQANQPSNVIQVSSHSTKRKAIWVLEEMVSDRWARSIVENTFAYGGVFATVIEAEVMETSQ